MPTPPKTTTTKPEKPKDTGRFITATEGQRIARVAKDWKDTPYGTGKYAGGGAVKGKNGGADCSGAIWKIYQEAEFPYGRYFNTVEFVNLIATDSHFIVAWLKDLVGTDADFVKGKHFFKQVALPQVGDIGWWNGHMAIYDNNAGVTDKGTEGNLWSARDIGYKFGPARINWFDNYVVKKTGKNYGIVKWYRYWSAP